MKSNALLSIIIPVYNAAPFLSRTVQSVLETTYEPFEVLLVDDGSTDTSYQVMEELASKDERIRIFQKENGGASSARNLGVRSAKGEWVGFVDSDDLIAPDMYENLMAGQAYCNENLSGEYLIQIGRTEEMEDGTPIPSVLPVRKEAVFIASEPFIRSLLLYTGDSSFCTKIARRALLLSHPFKEGVMGEDFLLHMTLLPDVLGVYIMPKNGYRVVHRAGSVTRRLDRTRFSRSYIDIVKHADYVEEEVVKKYPGLKEEALRFGLFERLDYLLHVPIADMIKENAFYQSVCGYLKEHFRDMWTNPYLTKKNKIYLAILTICPVLARKIHLVFMNHKEKTGK